MPNDSFRVLIVDDSSVARSVLKDVISTDPQLEVAGAALNGRMALDLIRKCKPDLVILDIEMPEMNGLATLTELRKIDRHLPVIMFSALTHRGATATLDALALGADDYVPKDRDTLGLRNSIEDLRRDLLSKIHALCAARSRRKNRSIPKTPLSTTMLPRAPEGKISVVAIGVSTGGPDALFHLLPQIPGDLPVPVVIVQHMPVIFTGILAQRLSSKCSMPVVETQGGEQVGPGTFLLAPGGKHMRLVASKDGVVVELDTSPPRNFCRPSVDILFESVVEIYGAGTLAVVLTGMGSDGLESCGTIRYRGGQIIVQDEESSVVWGMPGAVVRAGLADSIKPLDQLADEIIRRVTQKRHHGRNLTPSPASTRSLYVHPRK